MEEDWRRVSPPGVPQTRAANELKITWVESSEAARYSPSDFRPVSISKANV
jgi:hypothetical protein